jgi:hypothetical protein
VNTAMYQIRDLMVKATSEPERGAEDAPSVRNMKEYLNEAIDILEREYLGEKVSAPLHPGQMKLF